MLNFLSKGDLPIGGLSFEMNNIEGIGLFKGDVDIQMKTEESYIDLRLHCPGRGTQGSNCANRQPPHELRPSLRSRNRSRI